MNPHEVDALLERIHDFEMEHFSEEATSTKKGTLRAALDLIDDIHDALVPFSHVHKPDAEDQRERERRQAEYDDQWPDPVRLPNP